TLSAQQDPDLPLLGTGIGFLEDAKFIGGSMLSSFDDLGNFRVCGLLVHAGDGGDSLPETMAGANFMLETPNRPTLISQQAAVSPSMTQREESFANI
ncbi:hypothetical protein, partial [Desulfonatronum thiodismutans]|uniref:hypothetical protein n=1 Tax=Desulfonatronum thiodismutans TaxID=159290 RepID=UPI001F2289F0